MAKIPTYDSEAMLSTESPKALQDPKQMTEKGQEISALGEGLSGLGEYVNKLRDFQQKSTGMHLLRQSIQKRYVDTVNNPDTWGALDKVDEGFSQDIEAAAKHITSMEGREKFLMEAQSYVDRKAISLQSTIMNKQNKLTEATVGKEIDEKAKDIISSAPQEHSVALGELKEYVEGAKALYPGHQGIQKYYDHVMKTLPEKMFTADIGKWDQIEGDPHPYLRSIQKELQKGDKGWYKDLPPEKKEWAITETNKAMKQADVKMDYKQRNNQHKADKKATVLFAMNALTPEKLAESSVGMSQERFDLLNKNRDVITTEEPHPLAFADVLDFIMDTKHTERESVNYIIDQMNGKKISAQEGKDIIKMAMVMPEDDPVFKVAKNATLEQYIISQGDKNALSKEKRENQKTAWDYLKILGPEGAFLPFKKIMKDYNDQKDEKKDTQAWHMGQAKKFLGEEVIKSKPFVKNYPPEGVIWVDSKGNKIRVFKDGSYDEA